MYRHLFTPKPCIIHSKMFLQKYSSFFPSTGWKLWFSYLNDTQLITFMKKKSTTTSKTMIIICHKMYALYSIFLRFISFKLTNNTHGWWGINNIGIKKSSSVHFFKRISHINDDSFSFIQSLQNSYHVVIRCSL